MPVLDLYLPLLEEVVTLLDSHLARLDRDARASDDPVGEVYDSAEHFHGLGFAACQHYLSSTAAFHRVPKAHALTLGPKHRTGEPLVALVNGAANFWKHQDPWDAGHGLRSRPVELLRSLGVESDEYPMSNVLYHLVNPLPVKLGTLVPFLVQWRDALPRR